MVLYIIIKLSMEKSLVKKPKIACFIHSTTLELWKDAFLIEILEHLKSSKLLECLNYLCIVNTGLELDANKIESLYKPAKVIHYSKSTHEFENVTIRQLYTFCKMNPEYKVLYMHTKGVSYVSNHVFLPGVNSWNRFMRYCLVDHFLDCLRILSIYDTVGSNYRPLESGNGQHYSGNYWWANARYISKLPIDYLKDKYDPEFWLLQKEPLFFNVHYIENMYEQPYPIENYQTDVKHGFDDNVFFCKVGFPRTGLCNQLYNIANVLSMAVVQRGNKVVILDDFITDINTLEVKPSCYVLDIDKCNYILKPYNITLIYKNNVTMKIEKVEYGLRHIQVEDITEKVKTHFWKSNHLYIPRGTSLNDYVEKDPCPMKCKQLYIYYSLNGVLLQRVFHERNLVHLNPVEIKHSNYDFKPCSYVHGPNEPWLTRINRDDSQELTMIFDSFLNKLHFDKYYYDKATAFYNSLGEFNRINLIHLRNEYDAIAHWSKLNNMSENNYREKYETHILESVGQYIDKHDHTVIMTSFVENNPVIEQLKEEGYNVFCRDNEPIGREMNAIIDFLFGRFCNGIFIGNCDTKTWQGSTFSYALYNQLDSGIKSIFINMDDISQKHVIKYKE